MRGDLLQAPHDVGVPIDPVVAVGGRLFIGHPARWADWGSLLYSLQTGRPAAEKLRGMPFFEYCATDPEFAAVFNNAMTAASGLSNDVALQAYDFTDARLVVDVGGGHGAVLATILRRAPNARTRAEYEQLLRQAGFALTRVIPTVSPISVLEAVAV